RLRAAVKWRFSSRVSGKYMSATSAGVIGSFRPRSAERSASESVSGALKRKAAHSLRPKVVYAESSSDWLIGSVLGRGGRTHQFGRGKSMFQPDRAAAPWRCTLWVRKEPS